MTDQVTVAIERDTVEMLVGTVTILDRVAISGVVYKTVTRSRIACGDGCGFVVNVN